MLDTHVVDGSREDRKRKPGANEFEMLGLHSEDNIVDIRDEDGLEGFRTGCQSSMRSG